MGARAGGGHSAYQSHLWRVLGCVACVEALGNPENIQGLLMACFDPAQFLLASGLAKLTAEPQKLSGLSSFHPFSECLLQTNVASARRAVTSLHLQLPQHGCRPSFCVEEKARELGPFRKGEIASAPIGSGTAARNFAQSGDQGHPVSNRRASQVLVAGNL